MKSHKKIWGQDVVCFISIFFVDRHFLLVTLRCDHMITWLIWLLQKSENVQVLIVTQIDPESENERKLPILSQNSISTCTMFSVYLLSSILIFLQIVIQT